MTMSVLTMPTTEAGPAAMIGSGGMKPLSVGNRNDSKEVSKLRSTSAESSPKNPSAPS